MPTTYTIHLKNLQSVDKTFWCFLDSPVSEITEEVFANSSANLIVSKYQSGQDDSFTIPLQYVVQAGASNRAVALDTVIQSSIKKNTDLAEAWHADYHPANKGPSLYPASDVKAPPGNEVDILTNDFDKDQEPLKKWYSSLTFGVQSQNGFMGVTWSPDPSETYRIKPKVQFYVATGKYVENKLADISAISTDSATITEDSFDGNNECTVTLTSKGKWIVEPGNTNTSKLSHGTDILADLVKAHVNIAAAHAALVSAYITPDTSDTLLGVQSEAKDISTGIKINNVLTLYENDGAPNALITGTISVVAALGVGFAYMIVRGTTLTITKRAATGLEFDFSYSGDKGAEDLKELFKAGQSILFRTK